MKLGKSKGQGNIREGRDSIRQMMSKVDGGEWERKGYHGITTGISFACLKTSTFCARGDYNDHAFGCSAYRSECC